MEWEEERLSVTSERLCKLRCARSLCRIDKKLIVIIFDRSQ